MDLRMLRLAVDFGHSDVALRGGQGFGVDRSIEGFYVAMMAHRRRGSQAQRLCGGTLPSSVGSRAEDITAVRDGAPRILRIHALP